MIMVHCKVILGALACGFAAHGCLDFTPVTVVPATADGASPVEAGADGALSGKEATCLACISAGMCASLYDACSASGPCNSALQCLTRQCVAGGAVTEGCLSACEDDAGVTSGPASMPFSALLGCLIASCEAACI
jgi:hypothetical protein